jgi:hypothetical protein
VKLCKEKNYLFNLKEASFCANIFLTQLISAVHDSGSRGTSNAIVVRLPHATNSSDASLKKNKFVVIIM